MTTNQLLTRTMSEFDERASYFLVRNQLTEEMSNFFSSHIEKLLLINAMLETEQKAKEAKLGKKAILPSDMELEECVLGAMMLETSCEVINDELYHVYFKPKKDEWEKQSVRLSENLFFAQSSVIIYNTIKKCYTDYGKVDLILVTTLLRNNEDLNLVGGIGYVARLTSRINSISNLTFYIRILEQYSIGRKLINLSNDSLYMLLQDNGDPLKVLDIMQEKLSSVFNQINNG